MAIFRGERQLNPVPIGSHLEIERLSKAADKLAQAQINAPDKKVQQRAQAGLEEAVKQILEAFGKSAKYEIDRIRRRQKWK